MTAAGEPLAPVSVEPLLRAERRFTWEGEEWLAAHRQLFDPPLRLSLAAPTAPSTQPFAAAARRGVLALLAVLGVSVVLTLVLSRSVSAPIGRLTRAAEEVAQGNLDGGTLALEGPDELRRLGRAFESMTSSLRRLLRRVSQQEAAAAVGEFAASLAHEVRNPLTSVRLDLERARERLDPGSRAEELVERSLKQIERLDASVTGALRLARSGSLELAPVDLRAPIAAALSSAAPIFAGRALPAPHWSPPDHPICVQGNAAAIEQMVLNLLMNAADAVEAGGRVAVESASEEGAVRLSVADTGRGMGAEEQDRALEPFFTTRPEGTGLGLTVVQRIAHAHGAELAIASRPGQGTAVTVTFGDVP
jgi:signal transduction histidine kinase